MSIDTDAEIAMVHSFKDVERNLIDQEIVELERKLLNLREKRNRLAPISSLPAELLSRIFLFVRLRRTSWKHYEWTVVSHICQHWRTIAIGTSTLWTSVVYNDHVHTMTSQPWALTAFQRSGKCKIDVAIAQTYSEPTDLLFTSLIISDFSRIRSLRLSIPADTSSMRAPELQKLANFLRNPAPVLEELFLLLCMFVPQEEEELPLRIGFKDDISWFDGFSPQLKRLDVTFAPSDMTGLRCQNLTSLQLHGLLGSLTPRISFSALLNLLSETPKLQTLNLDHSFSIQGGTPVLHRNGRISLGSLTSSTLTFPPLELTHFLNAISVPSTSKAVITVTSTMELSDILDGLQGYLSQGLQSPFYMKYSLLLEYRLLLELWPHTAIAGHKSERQVSINLPLDADATIPDLNNVPLSQLQTLHFAEAPPEARLPDYSEIFEWCHALPSITDLRIDDAFTDLFLDFLFEKTDAFPALERLTLRPSSMVDEGEILDSLHGILVCRANYLPHTKLQRLSLVNFGVYDASSPLAEKIEEFRGLVLGMHIGDRELW